MRPIRLILSAFGPYINETIEMHTLGEKGIYLITGDTGAGKTTIFDAITYALYGEASGSIRDVSMFRCQYAGIETPTYVELEFEYKGETYRVRRNPEYERPAKKGGGITTEGKNAQLHLPNGKVITKPKEVDKEMEAIMGVTCSQFTQIAMIAQGEFLKLLHASTEERSAIFQKIFQTKNFQKLQYRLKDDASALGKEYEKLRLGIAQYLEGIQGYDLEEGTTQAKIEGIQKHLQLDQKEVEALDASIQKVEDEKSATELSLKAAGEKKVRLVELKEVTELEILHSEKLKEARERFVVEKEKMVERDERSQKIFQLLEEYKQYKEVERLESSYKEKAIEQEQLDKKLTSIKESQNQLKKEALALKEEASGLDGCEGEFQGVKERLSHWEKSLIQQEDLYEECKLVCKEKIDALNETTRIVGILKTSEEKRNGYVATLDRLKDIKVQEIKVQQKLDGKEKQIAEASHVAGIIRELQDLMKDLEEKQSQYIASSKEVQRLEGIYKATNQVYMDEQAGILAQGLEEGIPCPVCGATHHIELARITEEAPTKEDLESMKKDSDEAMKVANIHMQAAGNTRTLVESGKKQVCSQVAQIFASEEMQALNPELIQIETIGIRIKSYVEELQVEVDKLKLEVDQIKKDVEEHDRIQKLLPKYEESLEKGREQLEDSKKQVAVKEEQIRSGIQRAEENQSLLHNQLGQNNQQGQVVRDRVSLSIQKENLLEALVAITEGFHEYKNLLNQSYMVLEGKAQRLNALNLELLPNNEKLQRDFEAKYNQCLLDEKEIGTTSRTIEEAIGKLRVKLGDKTQAEAEAFIKNEESVLAGMKKAFEDSEQAYVQEKSTYDTLKGRLESLKSVVESMPEIDTQLIDGKLQELELRRKDLQKLRTDLISQMNSNRYNLERIVEKSEELLEVEYQYQWMKALSDTANGTLSRKEKIMLETYIQMGYFDRVIRRANLRLMKMTSGQYELKRREDVGASSGKKGLDLNVIDHYNGSQRSVKTLSGGESFKASLALALGLADEIQSSAGGIQLDTMFVDEGFGSLDEESLQQAIKILMELGEGNRLVGIISHVDELKEKMDRQLIISKNGMDGSSHRIRV